MNMLIFPLILFPISISHLYDRVENVLVCQSGFEHGDKLFFGHLSPKPRPLPLGPQQLQIHEYDACVEAPPQGWPW